MPELFPFLLFLHTLGAIVALGPAFAFPLLGAFGGREPQHANFATRLSHRISDVMVEPFVILAGVTGVLLIWSRSLPIFEPYYRWLLVSIVLYVIATGFSWLVQRPTILRIIDLTGGHVGGSIPALASPGPGAAGGPPPELAAAIGRSRRNGLILMALSVAMILLMVMKPSLGS
jgi:uncharacterized membrane protein